jgi:hypothetical protein
VNGTKQNKIIFIELNTALIIYFIDDTFKKNISFFFLIFHILSFFSVIIELLLKNKNDDIIKNENYLLIPIKMRLYKASFSVSLCIM